MSHRRRRSIAAVLLLAAGVPAVYEMNGREFIAVCVGALPAGRAEPATSQAPGEYIAFALPVAARSAR